MSSVSLDLRSNCTIDILVDFGVVDVITFAGFQTLDTGYTITLDAGETSEQVYTVGSGLTLGTNSIAWALDT